MSLIGLSLMGLSLIGLSLISSGPGTCTRNDPRNQELPISDIISRKCWIAFPIACPFTLDSLFTKLTTLPTLPKPFNLAFSRSVFLSTGSILLLN
uniref:Secreted protein n=1 Tax=Picea glauca TaxID=3330 RepID=A0A101LVW3_PICGL|nr:hypothetical protein ABT39_MTgene1797 [Picea glauca]QHR86349.1 hypothetical protein Q903MT_gene348 [Picea sitchensis]